VTINRRGLGLMMAGGLAAIPAAVMFPVLPARATSPAVFTGLIDGVGAGGHDVVAYFSENAARPGDPAITATHEGVTYRFASTANRDVFLADPQRHLPAYGGYCAYAVANGYTAKIDPEAFTVAGGRLFLNYSKSVRARWEKNRDGFIRDADANWTGVLAR
jgi:hypothetical protein